MNRIQFIIVLMFFSGLEIINAQCPQVVWQDEFEQTSLDDKKWSFQIGDGCDINLCGWGNNELQWYQSDNVEVSNGVLKLIAKEEKVGGKPYTSARIRTLGKGDWTYGRFEASIKLPSGKGIWPAFWMLPTQQKYGGWPQSGEIDIVELIGSESDKAHGTIHYGKPWPKNASSPKTYSLHEGSFNEQFHTFAVEWEAGEIRWLLDDYLYSTKRVEDIAPNAWPFDEDFHFILNLAVGGYWPGAPDATTSFPQTMEVEYVRAYDGFFPSMSGNRKIEKNSKAIKYTINNAPDGSSFNWTLPNEATITHGKGTAEITVDWGSSDGEVKVLISNDCSSQEITLQVLAENPVAKLFSIEDFDTQGKQLNHTFSTGSLSSKIANPASNDINSSKLVGKYLRQKGSRYDVMVFDISDLNPADFVKGTHQFFIDIYTKAPPGTEILIQLEDKNSASGTNYPKGRHSRFHTFTTKQNEWHRLELKFQNQPDSSIKGANVNQFVFLFAPNSNNGDIFYFDNFDVYSKQK
ncbi:MAG: family 16 glycosylhydrolase [Saprospiraceae bacterium]